jgi:ketosteroid isomerase-like protein
VASDAETVVRRFYEAFSQGRPLEEIVTELEPFVHPEVEYVNPHDAVEPGVRRGVAGWRAAVAGIVEGLGQEAKFTIEELHERGDQVLVILSIRTGGTVSGVEVAGPTIGAVWTVRDGLVRRLEWCWDPDDARALFEAEPEAR